jgi:hypothetical protein
MSTLFTRLEAIIEKVRSGVDEKKFLPQNEADFNAYIFHTWLSLYPSDGKFLHLEARVKGYKQTNGHFRGHADLAYGPTEENPKTKREWIVRPKLIVESK